MLDRRITSRPPVGVVALADIGRAVFAAAGPFWEDRLFDRMAAVRVAYLLSPMLADMGWLLDLPTITPTPGVGATVAVRGDGALRGQSSPCPRWSAALDPSELLVFGARVRPSLARRLIRADGDRAAAVVLGDAALAARRAGLARHGVGAAL